MCFKKNTFAALYNFICFEMGRSGSFDVANSRSTMYLEFECISNLKPQNLAFEIFA